MVLRTLFLALATGAIAAPLSAATLDDHMQAPSGDADTRYCMKVEAITGTRIERVKCWTRAEWKDQGVDVDAEWANEGVRVID